VLKQVQCEYFKPEEVTTRSKIREQEKREERWKQKKNEIENIPQLFYFLECIDLTRCLIFYKLLYTLFIRNTGRLCYNFGMEVSTACKPNV